MTAKSQWAIKFITQVSKIIGLGKLKAVFIGIAGITFAYLTDDHYLLMLTIGFTILAYIVYAMEWGLNDD